MTDSASITVSDMILPPASIERLVRSVLDDEGSLRAMELRAENVRLAAFANNVSAYLVAALDCLAQRDRLPGWAEDCLAEVWLDPCHDKVCAVVTAANRMP